MTKLYVPLDDKLVTTAGWFQERVCRTLSVTPPQFRSMVSIVALALGSICGLIGSYQLYGTAGFNVWIIPYVLWLFLSISGLCAVVSALRTAPVWSAAEHRKLLLGAVMTRANDANIRFVMALVTVLMVILVIAGILLGAGQGAFFFAMVTLYFVNYSLRGFLAATEVPPLQGRFINDTGF